MHTESYLHGADLNLSLQQLWPAGCYEIVQKLVNGVHLAQWTDDNKGYIGYGWIGLDLFNDDTRPSGHISRPTQVNVSQSCFHSLITQVWSYYTRLGASWSW